MIAVRDGCAGRIARREPRRWRLLPAFLAGLWLVGCSGIRKEEPPQEIAIVEPADFIIADNLNDTWNTVGQILVRLPGVEYESRSQMMGLYTVSYRGEPLLIRTQGLVMEQPTDGIRTRVMALQADGKPTLSAKAAELIAVLKERVPLEIEKYRVPIDLKPKKAAKKKPAKKAKKKR